LLVVLNRIRDGAERLYMNQLQLWAALAPHQKKKTPMPRAPAILEKNRHGQ